MNRTTVLCFTAIVALFGIGYESGHFFSRSESLYQVKKMNYSERGTFFSEIQKTIKTSVSPKERISATQDLKILFQTATTSVEQAKLINVIISISHAAHEPYIFNEVFRGEPFEKYRDSESEQHSLQNLSFASYALHPTAYAAQLASQGYVDTLHNLEKKESNAHVEKQIDTIVEAMMKQYNLAEKTINADLMEARGDEERIFLEVAYYRWQGHILGEIAGVKPESLQESVPLLLKSLNLAEEYKKKTHNNNLDQLISSIKYGYIRVTSKSNNPLYRKQSRIFGDELADGFANHPADYPAFMIMFKQLEGMNSYEYSHDAHNDFMKEIRDRVLSLGNSSEKMSAYLHSRNLYLEMNNN